MGMSLYEMFEDDTPIELHVGRGVVNFRFNNAAFSPAMMGDLADVQNTDTNSLQASAGMLVKMAGMVAALVTWWDVIGHDGEPVPLTKEAVSQLPVRFLSMVISKITEAQEGEVLPGEPMNATLNDTLSRQAKSGTAPNGIPTSSPVSASTARRGNSSPVGSNHAKPGGARRRS